MPRNEAEFEAQKRYNVPIDKAGRDYIARPMNKKKFNEGWDRIWGKKNKEDSSSGDKEHDGSG